MKRGTKKVLKCVIVVGSCIAVIAVIVLAFVLWYRNIEKEIQELKGTPVPTPCVTATLEPTGAEVPTKMPEKDTDLLIYLLTRHHIFYTMGCKFFNEISIISPNSFVPFATTI